MSDTPRPSETPNVVIQNPKIRRVANWVISTAALILFSVAVFDASAPAVDLSEYTTPATSVVLFLAGAFGISVIRPNIPK